MSLRIRLESQIQDKISLSLQCLQRLQQGQELIPLDTSSVLLKARLYSLIIYSFNISISTLRLVNLAYKQSWNAATKHKKIFC